MQRQLSEKLKTYSQFSIIVWESILNLEHFQKNESHGSSISEVFGSEKRAYINA